MANRGKDAPPGLDVDQDLDFQRSLWRVESVGQSSIFAAVLAAVLGVFGPGVFDRRAHDQADDGSVSVEYPSRVHANAPHVLRVRLAPPEPAAQPDALELWISSELFDAHTLRETVPAPDSIAFAEGGLTFRFARHPSASRSPSTVTFELEGRRPGWVRARVAVPGSDGVGSDGVAVDQFVYP